MHSEFTTWEAKEATSMGVGRTFLTCCIERNINFLHVATKNKMYKAKEVNMTDVVKSGELTG